MLSACSELVTPLPSSGSAPSSAGIASGSRTASIPEARSISRRWPSSPNPVTSVQALARYASRQAAAEAADCTIVAIAASTRRDGDQPARRRGEDHAGAERLGQDQPVAGTQPGLAQQLSGPRPPGHGKAERELGALGAVPADQHGAGRLEHVEAAAQHVKEVVLDDRRARRRQGGDRQCGLRRAAHRIDVAERMGRGDPAEQIRVVDHRAEEIDGLQQRRRAGERDQRRIVRAVEADHHGAARRRMEPRHDPAEHRRRHLGGATAAAHRVFSRLRAASPAIRGSAASSAGRSSPSAATAAGHRRRTARARRRPARRRCRSAPARAFAARRAAAAGRRARGADWRRAADPAGPRRPRPSRADGRASSRRRRPRRSAGLAGERSLSSTAMKPSGVSGRPVSASHGAAPASVTHSASSNSIRLPSAQSRTPGATRTTALPASTVTR